MPQFSLVCEMYVPLENVCSITYSGVSEFWYSELLFLSQALPKECCFCCKFLLPASCGSSYSIFREYYWWIEFCFLLSLCELVVLQILSSVNENLSLCKTIAQKGNTQEMSFVFSTCCFMAAFCGSTLLALLEKCSMERMWALIKRGKETLMAMFPDSW